MQELNGPIFVVGAAGSGTTLMRLILDSHDDIAIAQETGFARVLLANEFVPFWEFGGEWHDRLGISRDELEARMREFYGGMFRDFAASRGARRWGDKTPFHLWHLELLARVFPDAVFIGMVRHPGAVANSIRRRMGHEWRDSVRFWVRDNVEMVNQAARLGERMVLCRYEDLVTSPEPVLRELFEWLGEPWSDNLLAFHEVHRRRGTDKEVEGATRSDEPIDPVRTSAWTATMDDERWAHLSRGRVRRVARFLGYEPTAPLPVSPWGEGTSTGLLHGSDLPRLMAQRPGAKWDKRPRPSFANRPLTPQELKRLRRNIGAGRPQRLVDRAEERYGEAGRRLLRRLPPPLRRRARGVLAWARR